MESLEELQQILRALKSRHVKGCAHAHERLKRTLLPLVDLDILTNGKWKLMQSEAAWVLNMYTSTHTQQAIW